MHDERVKNNDPWKKNELLYILVSLLDYVKKLFEKEIFHSDVKPQNIVLI